MKSTIQRACAALPFAQEETYYFLQRTFGSLRRPPGPMPMMTAAAEIVRELEAEGLGLMGARVFEVGTGRRVDMPIAFYLCGAERVVTCDLHRYLKPELVMYSVRALLAERESVARAFDVVRPAADILSRLDRLGRFSNAAEIMAAAGIEYLAPADATRTPLPAGSIDLHFSYTVLEHVPGTVITGILREASRLLSAHGLACHHIDPSDHFSHDDRSIGPIHFLRFTQTEWDRYANNQFAYHNRLRAPQYREIYREAGHDILKWLPIVDEPSLGLIRNGFPLAPEFRNESPELLSTVVLRVLSRPHPA